MTEQPIIQVIAQSDKGKVREQQEDHCVALALPNRQLALLLVADGMGGHAGGALASMTVAETVQQTLQAYLAALQPLPTRKLPEGEGEEAAPMVTQKLDLRTVKLADQQTQDDPPTVTELLRRTVQQAHLAVREKKADPENVALAQAGSTLTVALVIGRQLYLAHVGDSRAYLWRQSALRQLTHDHSGAALLVAAGMITSDEVRGHEGSHLLYRFLGGTDQEATPELIQFALEPDDLLLLCSDGLWGMMADAELALHLTAERDLALLARTLIGAANANGGQDNISVVLARIGEKG